MSRVHRADRVHRHLPEAAARPHRAERRPPHRPRRARLDAPTRGPEIEARPSEDARARRRGRHGEHGMSSGGVDLWCDLSSPRRFVGPEVQWFALSPILILVGAALFLLLVGALTPQWPRGLYAAVDRGRGRRGRRAGDGAVGRHHRSGPEDARRRGAVVRHVRPVRHHHDLRRARPRRPDERRLPAPRGPRRARGLRPVPGRRHRRRRDGVGQRPHRAVHRARDDVARRSTSSPPATGARRAAPRPASSTSCSAGSRRRSCSTASPSSTAPPARRTSPKMVDAVTNRVPVERNDALVLAGVALLLVGLGFKVAAVPFHVWTPDVYQGAPTPVTAFMASVGKVGRVRRAAAGVRRRPAGRSATTGARRSGSWPCSRWSSARSLAVVQTDVKRMLAYSSISHAGFILVGVEAAAHRAGEADSGLGVPSALVYLLAYAVMVAGTFGVVALIARQGDRRTDLDAFRGLGRTRPTLALALTVFLVAQAGVPFTSGFIAKFGVIRAGVDEHSYALGDHRHGLVGRRRLPVPADHGQRLDGRPGERRRAGARSRSRPAWRSSPPPPSRCSSASSPAGCSTPPSTPPSSPASRRPPSECCGHRSAGAREARTKHSDARGRRGTGH